MSRRPKANIHPCWVELCGKPAHRRGLCVRHYKQDLSGRPRDPWDESLKARTEAPLPLGPLPTLRREFDLAMAAEVA